MTRHLQPEKSVEKVRDDYNRIAPHYAVTRDYERSESMFFKPYIKKHQQILDIGCGSGREYPLIQKLDLNLHYTGVDISTAQLAEAKKRFPEGHFVEGNMLELPFPDHQYDVAVLAASLHHLPTHAARLKALEEASRVLKPGGIVCMTNWNLVQNRFTKYWLTNVLRSVITLGRYSFKDFFIPWKNNQGEVVTNRYYYAFSKRDIAKLAKQAGFTILENFYTRGDKKDRIWRATNLVTILKKSE